jgi:hypothetical protein
VVLLVGLNSRQRGKLERPIKPKTCAPADLEAAMDYAGKATGLGDCRRIVERASVARCGNWARIDPPKAVIRSRLLRVERVSSPAISNHGAAATIGQCTH